MNGKKSYWKTFWNVVASYVFPLLLGMVGIVIIVSLVATYDSAPDKFWPQATLLVGSIGIIIAAFSLRFAQRSLQKTGEALELTRATIRPFLAFTGSPVVNTNENIIRLEFKIKNTGSTPASDIHAYIQFFTIDEVVTEDNVSNKYVAPTEISALEAHDCLFLFPDHTVIKDYALDLQQKENMEHWQDINNKKTKFRIRITYQGIDGPHTVIQTGRILGRVGDELLTSQIPPQKSD
jgi:hypothetical protein